MMVDALSPAAAATGAPAAGPARSGYAALGQEDFFRLLTVQMQMQDPFDPVDNTQMLAQMAQFSSLASTTRMDETLSAISGKLDALIALQSAATPAPAEPGADEQAQAPNIAPD